MQPVKRVLFVTFLIFIAQACAGNTGSTGPQFSSSPISGEVPVYHFAIHPLYNPTKLVAAYQPLIDYLNSHIQGSHLILEASSDYADFEMKYGAKKPEFILPNPWQTLQAMKVDYHVVAMAGEPQDFKGVFIVRKDSGIKDPADLKGRVVSYPSPTALAACIMPQYFLYEHGIDINTDIQNSYVGSQESSIMNAYMKLSAAGVTWPPPWRAFQKDHPQEAAELTVVWETDSLVNNSVMARNDMPPDLVAQIQKLLVELDSSPEGKEILAGMETARFLSASDVDYDVVRQFIENFEAKVRLVVEP